MWYFVRRREGKDGYPARLTFIDGVPHIWEHHGKFPVSEYHSIAGPIPIPKELPSEIGTDPSGSFPDAQDPNSL